MAFWNKHLKKGYIRWYVLGSRDWGRRKDFPQFEGKKLCQLCAHEVFTGENLTEGALPDVEEIVDFLALNELLLEHGVVAEAFNCPKCNGMLEIPESGKLLLCKHCGAPIKPEEVYEKIKPLLE
jgi:hypothetical protein